MGDFVSFCIFLKVFVFTLASVSLTDYNTYHEYQGNGDHAMHPFVKADILLPASAPMETWSVIACDQFVSQPEYWEAVQKLVGENPSTLNLILPESELEGDCAQAICKINETMAKYLENGIFRLEENCFIYVERTLQNGTIRKGVVGAVDLTAYDFTPQSKAAIRATEKTVAERIPPRMAIRRNAPVELPHVLLLCDDEEKTLVESLTAKKDTLPLLYDFDLMLDGGKIRGWLVANADARAFEDQISAYEQRMYSKYGKDGVLYAVGDGNHSLASAKGCYEENIACENARYALVELGNIHDDAQVFEPIHRIIKETDAPALLRAMETAIGKENGAPIHWHIGNESGTFFVHDPQGLLPVGIVQEFLDGYMKDHPGIIDYIHGEEDLRQLALADNALGLILPPVEKNAFFQGIIAGGTLPRKTFSMGHAREKRYYLEARKIK